MDIFDVRIIFLGALELSVISRAESVEGNRIDDAGQRVLLMARVVVCDVVSAYHLLGVLSFCVSKKDVSEVEVFLIPNMNKQFLVKEGVVSAGGVKIVIVHDKVDDKSFVWRFIFFTIFRVLRFMRGKTELYVGHHTYFKPTVLSKNITVSYGAIGTFSFEEGIGTYGGYYHHIVAARKYGMRFPRLKYFFRKILRSKLWVDESWALLSGGVLDCKRSSYLKALELMSSMKWVDGESFYQVEEIHKVNSAIFFSSPFVEAGVLSFEEYIGVLYRVKAYFSTMGLDVLFVLHPLENNRDRVLAHGFELSSGDCPAEVLINRFRPQVVAGFNSGVLLSANKLFDIKCVSFIGLLPSHAQDSVRLKGNLGRMFDAVVEYAQYEF